MTDQDKIDSLRKAYEVAWTPGGPDYATFLRTLQGAGWHYKADCVKVLLDAVEMTLRAEGLDEEGVRRGRNRLLYGQPDIDEDTFREVILPARQRAAEDQLNQALRDAGLHEFRFEFTGDDERDVHSMQQVMDLRLASEIAAGYNPLSGPVGTVALADHDASAAEDVAYAAEPDDPGVGAAGPPGGPVAEPGDE